MKWFYCRQKKNSNSFLCLSRSRSLFCTLYTVCTVHSAVQHGIFHQLNGRRFFKLNYQKSIRIFIHGGSLKKTDRIPRLQFIELSIVRSLCFFPFSLTLIPLLTPLYRIFLSTGNNENTRNICILEPCSWQNWLASTFSVPSTSLCSMHVYSGIIYLVRQQNWKQYKYTIYTQRSMKLKKSSGNSSSK